MRLSDHSLAMCVKTTEKAAEIYVDDDNHYSMEISLETLLGVSSNKN